MNVNMLFSGNFAPLFGFIMLGVMLRNNNTMTPKIKRLFIILIFIELIELIAYNVELWTAT